MKIVTQQIYDDAVKNGFPADFFSHTYFDKVELYAIPDGGSCDHSLFADCSFTVCSARNVSFGHTTFRSCEFSTVELYEASFKGSTLSNTHFRNCDLSNSSMEQTNMAHTRFFDCSMDQTDFLSARLDGCAFDRITTTGVRNLDTAVITMGGATDIEAHNNRVRIHTALSAPPQRQQNKWVIDKLNECKAASDKANMPIQPHKIDHDR